MTDHGRCLDRRGLHQAQRAQALLVARLPGEHVQLQRIAAGLAKRTYIVPWLSQPPVGLNALSKLVSEPDDKLVSGM